MTKSTGMVIRLIEKEKGAKGETDEYKIGMRQIRHLDAAVRPSLPPAKSPEEVERFVNTVRTYLKSTEPRHDEMSKHGIHAASITSSRSARAHVETQIAIYDIVAPTWETHVVETRAQAQPASPAGDTGHPAGSTVKAFAQSTFAAKLSPANQKHVQDLLAGAHIRVGAEESGTLQQEVSGVLQALLNENTRASGEQARTNIVKIRELQKDLQRRMREQVGPA